MKIIKGEMAKILGFQKSRRKITVLYSIEILEATKAPEPWDSMDGVVVHKLVTPNLELLEAMPGEDKVQLAAQQRHFLLRVGEDVPVRCDGFGCVWAGAGGKEVMLSALTWNEIGGVFLRVQQLHEVKNTWNGTALKNMPWWKRLVNWFLYRRCGNCLYFDRTAAEEWRYMTTHSFGTPGQGQTKSSLDMAMWDDVTKITAGDYKVPDIPKGKFGYCPRKDCGLSATLLACTEYKRKK